MVHLVQFYYDDRTAVLEDQNIANTLTKTKEKRWKWTAMARTFAKMRNVFGAALRFAFSTISFVIFLFVHIYVSFSNGKKRFFSRQQKWWENNGNKKEETIKKEQKASFIKLDVCFSWLRSMWGKTIWKYKKLPMNILLVRRWIVKVIDPVNWYHFRLLVVFPNYTLCETMLDLVLIKELNVIRFDKEISFKKKTKID